MIDSLYRATGKVLFKLSSRPAFLIIQEDTLSKFHCMIGKNVCPRLRKAHMDVGKTIFLVGFCQVGDE